MNNESRLGRENRGVFAQGDVLIIPVNSIPKNAKSLPLSPGNKIILALGEMTGHHHRIVVADREAELLTVPDTEDRFLRIMAASGVELVHEEHSTITLPPGDYLVRTQREYVPQALPRRVAD